MSESAKETLKQPKQIIAAYVPPAEGWISVEERLPEFSGTYIVAVIGPGDDGETYMGTLPADWSINDKRWHDLRGWGHDEVTHWQPLPYPPSSRTPEAQGKDAEAGR